MPKKTGPLTEAGKSISSLNAVTHGMTSRRPLIKGENPEHHKALHQRWHDAYPTDDPHTAQLVTNAADSEWILLRNQRQYDLMNEQLFQTPMLEWPKSHHEQYQLFTRYLTTAQRSLDRDRRAIQQHRREVRADAREQRAALLAERAEKAYQAANAPPPDAASRPDPNRKNNDIVFQYLLVKQENGKTVTLRSPTNEHMLHIAQFRFDTTLVRRLLTFENCFVPPEYQAFAARAQNLKEHHYLHFHMTFRSFRTAIHREQNGPLQEWPDLALEDAPLLPGKSGDSCPPKE